MKYLIIGLGNIGKEYENTRHNIGFMALDYFAKSQTDCVFSLERHAYIAKTKFKGRTIILAKPTTYMNLSGKALKFWMDKEDIPLENILIILDDIALPLGTIRMRMTGSDGGHNGLSHIIETLGHNKFNRLRFGIGDNFSKGRQVDYVLGKWDEGELATINQKLDTIVEIIKSFSTIGMDRTMNAYNKKP
ncbi:MAG: aminoacyl-tRNA hydrolase [Bacteroidales bacterium]|jgi:peptidyl-tRNA hydrolase, PTH1 family|nr:aminoacyl-tRNA hydrolase [Bacteroidales bacterium]MDY4790072.1 aminoacyl-tRNA hydrolase [Bacteroidales bacterium]